MSSPLTANFRSPAPMLRFLLVAVLGVIADLCAKVWAFRVLPTGTYFNRLGQRQFDSTDYQFIPGWLHFKVTANHGAVFGIGQGQRMLFLLVSLGAVLFLVYLFAASKRRQWFYQTLLGMLLAGVIGNLYDRLTFGYVRDMIYALPDRTWGGAWHLPIVGYPGPDRSIFPWIFNIADMLLCVGVALMLIYSLFYPPERTVASVEKGAEKVPA